MKEIKKALIAYISPGGSTADVAGILKKTLEKLDIEVTMLEIGQKKEYDLVTSSSWEDSILLIGTPVYVNRPLPQVVEFLESLEEGSFPFAAPFVTWGGVTSGIALYELADLINMGNRKVAGALKVPSSHSMILDPEKDPGGGHPDLKDKENIREFASGLVEKLKNGGGASIKADDLLILSREQLESMSENDIFKAGKHMPDKLISESLCTTCGMCAEICPVYAIEMDPYPRFQDNCIHCFKCVKECPEEAILCDLESVEPRVLERRKLFTEPLESVYYI